MLKPSFHSYRIYFGSHGIEPKRDLTHFLKIGFVVAGGGFIPIITSNVLN